MHKTLDVQLSLDESKMLGVVGRGHAKANAIVFLTEDVKAKPKPGRHNALALDYTKTSAPVDKVATFLPISDKMAEDEPAVRHYARERAPVYLGQAVDQYIINRVIARAQRVRPRWYETNSRALSRARERVASAKTYLSGTVYELDWRDHPSLPSGTILIGPLREALTVWTKGKPTVEVSNEHSDYFRRHITMLKAEQRLAVTVFRPQAIVLFEKRVWRRLRRLFNR